MLFIAGKYYYQSSGPKFSLKALTIDRVILFFLNVKK